MTMENNMKDQEILYKAVLQAEKNGYTEHMKYLSLVHNSEANLDLLAQKVFWIHKDEIIYSHRFAKAFFGEEDIIYSCNAWVNHLKAISRTENEINYLEKHLNA